jgi:hypothetical protein
MAIDITVHGSGVGTCSLSGREGEGLVVTFRDGTVTEGFLSQKAFMQLLKMKFAQQPKGQLVPKPPAGNGAAATHS